MMDEHSFIHISVTHRGTLLNEYTFANKEVLIGRGSDADVVIDNAGVSRQHAKVIKSAHGLVVQDLKSGNGTFVNGKQVEQATLNPGDSLSINKFILTVELSSERLAASSPAKAAESEVVEGGTVFLRPSEKNKILMQSRSSAASPRPKSVVKTVYKLDATLAATFFAGGVGFGFLCSWLFF